MLNDDCRSANEDANSAYEKDKFNQSYAYFIEQGRTKGLDIVIAHFSDYKDGSVNNGWTRENGVWRKTGELSIEFMYDKFPAKTDDTKAIKRDLQDRGVGVLNHPNFEAMLKDKQANYEAFSEVIPYTASVNGSLDEMVAVIEGMRNESLHEDLDTSKVFVKPRLGFGGKKIVVVNGEDYSGLSEIENEDYIIQPFLESARGIPELGIKGRHDFRVIAVNGDNKIAYVRLPPKEGLISNESYGGDIKYFEVTDVPKDFVDVMGSVDTKINQFDPRIYSSDMARGKSGKVWVYEMNGKPGQVWNPADAVDVEKTKELQNAILDALVQGAYKK